MKILSIETATEACSAAVYQDGMIFERYQLAPREHNRLILPMIESVLAEAGLTVNQLDALAFGRGPGSFTGVRIAAGVVQGIALGADLPVAPVSTLAALALEVFDAVDAAWAFPCIDARMAEVYFAVYGRSVEGDAVLHGAEAVLPPAAVTVPPDMRGVGVGSGWATYAAVLDERLSGQVRGVLTERFPRAGCVARLGAVGFGRGWAVAAEEALPVYLRDNVVKKPAVG